MVGIVKSSSNDDGIGEIIGLKSELGNMPIFLDPMIQCCSCDNLYWFPTFSLSNHEVWACQSLYLCVCPQIKQISTTSSKIKSQNANGSTNINHLWHLGMDQYLLIPFLGGWTSIYQLFWCSPGVQGFDTLPFHQPDFRLVMCFLPKKSSGKPRVRLFAAADLWRVADPGCGSGMVFRIHEGFHTSGYPKWMV